MNTRRQLNIKLRLFFIHLEELKKNVYKIVYMYTGINIQLFT